MVGHFQQRSVLQRIATVADRFQRQVHFFQPHVAEEAEPAEVDAEHRRFRSAHERHGVEQCAIAAQAYHQIDVLRAQFLFGEHVQFDRSVAAVLQPFRETG